MNSVVNMHQMPSIYKSIEKPGEPFVLTLGMDGIELLILVAIVLFALITFAVKGQTSKQKKSEWEGEPF